MYKCKLPLENSVLSGDSCTAQHQRHESTVSLSRSGLGSFFGAGVSPVKFGFRIKRVTGGVSPVKFVFRTKRVSGGVSPVKLFGFRTERVTGGVSSVKLGFWNRACHR
jgi:hypothetical protein